MTHTVFFATILALALSVSASAGEVNAGRRIADEVWSRYLSPAERKTLAAFRDAPAEMPAANVDPASLRAAVREGFAKMVRDFGSARRGQVNEPYDKDGVKGLWIRPDDADRRRVLLYLHGGGFVLGSAETGAPIAGYLAEAAEVNAFVLDYPLAPESPYPAQLDNAEAAYAMLLADGYRPEHIVVAGDSAGGNLTLTLMQRLREKGTGLPAAAYLISPWGDVTHSLPANKLKRDVEYILNDWMKEWSAKNYAEGEDLKNPLISPANADLTGFPPMLVQVGSFETLLDDSLTIVRNAALANVPARLSVWPGYGHDFQMFFSSLEGAEEALDEAADFLEEELERR